MRKGLFLGALLATMLVGGTALAERSSDSDNKPSRGHDIKQQVLEKQKEGLKSRSSRSDNVARRDVKQSALKETRVRPKGEVYGDQAARTSSKSRATSASGRNMSSTNRINTPAEVRAMMKMINPMLGAYRTSEAAESTDSYGGSQMSRISAGQGGASNVKNLSATGKINTPAEIRQFMKLINPMKGAYSTCAAAEGTDSYSDTQTSYTNLMKSANRNVNFKNERGQVVGSAKASTDAASKNKASREKLTNMVKEKMAKAKESNK
ncbi:MAG: hypothetical protein HOW73_50080 [Polyangiaceae bacterium]|nr:hypothetical protein [Polyangiaceae bacterium]